MSAQPRISREEERRLNLRTLAIASAASATAAIVTSQFWAGGTPIAAAVTPIIVAVVSELLHRPTEKIVQRLTIETQALPDPALEARRRPPPPEASEPPRPTSVYGGQKRQLPWRGIAVTAALGFVIGALLLTVPELIFGESIGKDRGSTSYFGGGRESDPDPSIDEPPPAVTQPQQEEQAPATTPTAPEEPQETETAPAETAPAETAPSTQTTPAPSR